ncbi:unnamed protein product [Calicophoron daubneyi]|uniref:CDK5 regulatory subunit-associated protein 3 n=1 Tax=Calicophoron daubneyi TaxID=300641 RepID=A0AAV2TKU0_CALDB
MPEWLINRKLLQKDYPKRLSAVEQKADALLKDGAITLDAITPYLGYVQILETIQKEDTTTDFFGRASQPVRSWRDLIDSYKKYNLHIAEAAEIVHDISSSQVPKCRNILSDRQKHITDLRQKIKEHTLNVSKKEDALEKAYKEIHLQVGEKHIKLRLAEEASKVPEQLNSFVDKLKELSDTLELYQDFSTFIRSQCRSRTVGQSEGKTFKCCPTLKQLISDGHILYFTWQHGHQPARVEADDDFIRPILMEEQLLVDPDQNSVTKSQAADTSEPPSGDEIVWSEGDASEIDFGDIEVESPEDIQIEVGDTTPVESTGSGVHPTTDANVAAGKDARYLLDTSEGRKALLNDLAELCAFLCRFSDDILEVHGSACDSGDIVNNDSRNPGTSGSATLQNMIMQNAPQSVQSVSAEQVSRMREKVEHALGELTNSSVTQLLMIRTKPGYLDRLVTRLVDLRRQVDRARGRVTEAQLRIEEASAEQDIQTGALIQYRATCRSVVKFLEGELTKLCNRPIQIIGQVLDL